MKAKRNEAFPFAAKCVAIGLTLVVLAAAVLYCLQYFRPSTYTVYEDDGYYSETTYYRTEQAFERAMAELEQKEAEGSVRTHSLNAGGEAQAQQPRGEFVSAAVKSVWVYEQTDENGNVFESRLLTKQEVEQAEEKLQELQEDEQEIVARGQVFDQDESFERLDLTFTIYRENSDHDNASYAYVLDATASWDNLLAAVWEQSKAAEEAHVDYAAFTWGGEGALKRTLYSDMGYYYNGAETPISVCDEDQDVGIMWQFHEKSGLFGKEMEFARFTANLDRQYPLQEKKAQCKFTYVHTFNAYAASIKFSAGVESGDFSGAADVSLSSEKDNWKIVLFFDELEY